MKKNDKTIRVIVADACYDKNGLSTPVIPLGAGLVATHAKFVNPEISVEVFKLGAKVELMWTSATNFTFVKLDTTEVFDTVKITSCPTGSVSYKGCCSISVAII